MKHGTLSDRVDPGSAVHFHLPTSLPKTDHPEIFDFHSQSRLVNRSRRDLSNHAPHVAGDVLDLVDHFDPRFPCLVPTQKFALSCRGGDSPVPGKTSFPPHSDLDLLPACLDPHKCEGRCVPTEISEAWLFEPCLSASPLTGHASPKSLA